MNQSQLNHAVASATGETLTTVKSLGFSMMEPRHDLPSAESVIAQHRRRHRPRKRRKQRHESSAA